jgi:TetR/AcrR family transcriptional regulator, tetracycline repressor protein
VKGQRGRPRARFEGLDTDRIINAAMEIVDTEGIEALSMRRLGNSLGVDPMAIYYHVPNKDTLIAGLVRRVYGEIAAELDQEASASWNERVRFWASTYLRVARVHHQLVIHLINHAEAAGDEVMQVNEVLYRALVESGLSAKDVMHTADMIVDYLHGLLLSDHPGETIETDWREAVARQLDGSSENAYPAIRHVFRQLQHDDLTLDPAFGIDVILAGVQNLNADAGED